MEATIQQNKPKKGNGLKFKDIFSNQVPKYFLIVATIIVVVVFTIIEPKFLTVTNLLNVLVSAALTGTLGIGMLMALIVGEMNFALGSQATVAAAIVGILMAGRGVPYPIAILCGIGFCVFMGFIGIWVNIKIGVPTFIATLALAPFADGLTKVLTNNTVFYSDKWPATPLGYLGQKLIGPIPVLAIVFLLLVVLAWVLLDHTRLGRYMYSVGANPTASVQVGINVNRIKIFGFLLSSAIVAFGGMLIGSREYKVWPTMGSEVMMEAIAIAMLSATFLRPGRFNIQGVLVAAIFVTMVQSGVTMIGASLAIRYLVQGLTFLIAVGFIAMTRKGGLPSVQFGR
jgi:ribose/xylose/arabinose/galactoside ABC-type transport system permease subunit